MKCFKTIITSFAAFAMATTLHAQAPSKAETKLYTKTVAKPSVKACGKFLSTYPGSVYAPEITKMRDSIVFFTTVKMDDAISVEKFLGDNPESTYAVRADELLDQLNRTQTSVEEAVQIAKEVFGEDNGSRKVLPYRKDNAEHVAIVQASGEDNIRIAVCKKVGNEWEMTFDDIQPVYTMSEGAMKTTVSYSAKEEDQMQIVKVHGRRMLYFTYCNIAANTPQMEMVSNLMSLDGTDYSNAIFYGLNLGKKNGKEFRIEGRSPESMAQGGMSHEQAYLSNAMATNSQLTQISQEDALTDDSIEWWLKNNPGAMTSAGTLNFGSLPEECSLIAKYKKATKENSSLYGAAVIDFRGYTVIVSYSKSAKKYSLVWAEPECKNQKTDRYLSNIYFEGNGSTLDLFYYKGKTTFKYFINLSSKTIRRQ